MDAIYSELDILLASFVLGVCLTLAYDLLRLGRRILHKGWLWTGIEDILFWLLAALCFMVMSLQKNAGNFRWYMIGGGVAGGYLCLFLEKMLKISYKNVTKWLHRKQK